MLKHLNPSMGFGRVYGEWVLALWQSRNGDYILWKDRVPSIHSSCIWFNFFSPFYTVHHFFLSLSISFAIVVLFDVVHLKYFECMNVVFVYVFMYKCSYRRNATGTWTNLQYYANFYIGLWELYLYIFWCGFGVCVCADFRVEQEGNIPFHAISNNIIDNMVIIIWMLPKFSTMYKICLSMNEYTIFSNAFPV